MDKITEQDEREEKEYALFQKYEQALLSGASEEELEAIDAELELLQGDDGGRTQKI